MDNNERETFSRIYKELDDIENYAENDLKNAKNDNDIISIKIKITRSISEILNADIQISIPFFIILNHYRTRWPIIKECISAIKDYYRKE